METIGFFRGEYSFLSNFFSSPMTIDELFFPTAEHLFQSLKTNRLDEKLQIAEANTPGTAKRLGRKAHLKEDWEEIKVKAMLWTLMAKFNQNPFLAHKLFNTGEVLLVEGNSWHDNFWGNCTCRNCASIVGQNQLGKLLMQVRLNFVEERDK